MAKRHPKMTHEERLREQRARAHYSSDGSVSYSSSRRRRRIPRPAARVGTWAEIRRYVSGALSSDDTGASVGAIAIGGVCLGAACVYFIVVGSPI